MNDPLSQLRDIHLPTPVSWWPPAPGWWLLLALLILVAVMLGWYLRRRSRRLDLYRAALQELDEIRQHFDKERDSSRLAAELSRLLRRVAISIRLDEDVAGLTGTAWLAWLDAQVDGNSFTEGAGQFLTDGAYRPIGELQDADELLDIVEDWLKKVTREAARV